LVGAYADAGDGWGVLVEQQAAHFDGNSDPSGQPVVIGATVLTAALAIVFILLAFFDRRRRAVYRRTDEAKHAFFATVGHELRTPLTILKGYSDTLTARWDSLSDDAKEMLVSNMAPAAQRMGALVEKLLLASNIQAEAYVKPVPRPTPIPDVVRRVVDRWRPLAPLHTFGVDIDPLLPEAIADADALEQVLGQLIDNAVKYSPSGGRVLVSATRSRKGVDVMVTDDGVGLPANVREIFEPLVQGEAVDTRVHDEGGAGVGLYIVRTLVRDMGGDVRAERREVPGSRFVVSLKAARTKTAARATTPV
jgi:signal transduction histidine kinase